MPSIFPDLLPEYIRPLFCEGAGPFRWVALSGDPADIYRTDELALKLFPENEILTRWIHLARERVHFQGLPARICWLGYGERARMGEAMNELVRSGELKAPIAIGRDHLDTGSVASPVSRDGADEGWFGCDCGLADSECAAEYGQRCELGVVSSWRRRWHGIFAARGTGMRGRWDEARRRSDCIAC